MLRRREFLRRVAGATAALGAAPILDLVPEATPAPAKDHAFAGLHAILSRPQGPYLEIFTVDEVHWVSPETWAELIDVSRSRS